MEPEREVDAAGGQPGAAPPRDAGFRESVPQRPHEHSRVSSMSGQEQQQLNGHTYRQPTDMEISVLTRLEQQVAFNYNMIQGHHQELTRMSEVVTRLQHDMGAVIRLAEEMRADVQRGQLRPLPSEPNRYDPRDVEVLAAQIATVTTRVSQVDNLAVQLDLMKHRMHRMEHADRDAGPSTHRPPTAPGHGDATPHEGPHGLPGQPQGLPSLRASAVLSPEHTRHPSYMQAPPHLDTMSATSQQPSRGPPGQDPHAQPPQHHGNFRPVEAPAAPSGWRPAESFGNLAVPPPPMPGQPLRPSALDPETASSGWASINHTQNIKRAYEDRRSPHDGSHTDSPKRPKLAPLKPRSSYGDETPQHSYPHSAQPSEYTSQARPRLGSGDGQAHLLPTPASANSAMPSHSYRFITSTGQPPDHLQQDPWRHQEIKQEPVPTSSARLAADPPAAPARGRGSRGGGRGSRGGRGGKGSRGGVGANSASATRAAPTPEQVELAANVPPEWREMIQSGTHTSPTNGGKLIARHPFSPSEAARGVPLELVSQPPMPGLQSQPLSAMDMESPATPLGGSADGGEGSIHSASKKSRSKPIRNSEGVLIRKDGRPDMRSVSSANNLRKVHAKKEAERISGVRGSSEEGEGEGDVEEGYESGEEIAESERERRVDGSGVEKKAEEVESYDPATRDNLEKHREMMSMMFTHPQRSAEAWFPRGGDEAATLGAEAHEAAADDTEAHVEEDREMGEEGANVSVGSGEKADVSASAGASELTPLESAEETAVPTGGPKHDMPDHTRDEEIALMESGTHEKPTVEADRVEEGIMQDV
nr:hypothetical protein B0A51_07259 [Rachicladosporium sp. CCFEE 5018]